MMSTRGSAWPLPVPIGHVVKAWRQARGWTTVELAARLGRGTGYVSQLETDKIHQPKDEQLASLAAALEIPLDYLVLRRLPDLVPEGEVSPASPQPTPPVPGRSVEEQQRQRLLVAIQGTNHRLDRLSEQLEALSGLLSQLLQPAAPEPEATPQPSAPPWSVEKVIEGKARAIAEEAAGKRKRPPQPPRPSGGYTKD